MFVKETPKIPNPPTYLSINNNISKFIDIYLRKIFLFNYFIFTTYSILGISFLLIHIDVRSGNLTMVCTARTRKRTTLRMREIQERHSTLTNCRHQLASNL